MKVKKTTKTITEISKNCIICDEEYGYILEDNPKRINKILCFSCSVIIEKIRHDNQLYYQDFYKLKNLIEQNIREIDNIKLITSTEEIKKPEDVFPYSKIQTESDRYEWIVTSSLLSWIAIVIIILVLIFK